MKRINPAEVPEKCIKLGIQPWQGCWFHPKAMGRKLCLACAVGIEAISHVGITAVAQAIGESEGYGDEKAITISASGLSIRYAIGLSDGWENVRHIDGTDEEYVAGREDGSAAWEACVNAGLTSSRPL